MTAFQHFVSISGGKDSTATACLAIERADRRGYTPRFLFADTGNEHPLTLAHVAYLGQALGVTIETVRADFSSLFAARREAIARDWPRELKRTQHTKECNTRRATLPPPGKGCRASPERGKALRDWLSRCNCPVKVSPPVPDHLILRAVELMQPCGNPFLDMAMLHGRFPSSKSRFCTEELKLAPMERVKDPVRRAGTPIVEWIGERAEESEARAARPVIECIRCSERALAILYRPIHGLSAAETFAIAKRHGLKPNPLYLMGMGRVGCMPCVMCTKDELREIGMRFPDQIARIAEWERIVGAVARHANAALALGDCDELISSFLSYRKPSPGREDKVRPTIRDAVEWSRTGRGGRNFDLLVHLDEMDAEEAPARCSSAYGLCE